MLCAQTIGLRMYDSIAVVVLTAVSSILHQTWVFPPASHAAMMNYVLLSTALTLVTYCAGYHAECTKRRRWMWCPQVDVAECVLPEGQSMPQVGWPTQLLLGFENPAYVLVL